MKLSTRWPRYLWLPGAVISIYVLVSYLIMPATWARIEHEPGLTKRAMVTSTAQGIPGDAINVGLIDATQGTQTSAGATKSAVWVMSAGPNGQIETPYTQPMTTAAPSGDDIAVRVQ